MKIYVVAGNHQEFIHYRKVKFEDLQVTSNPVNFGDIINVSSTNVLRGVQDPHGVFIGTWRMHKDIGDIIDVLQMCQKNAFSNRSLLVLKDDWEKYQASQRPTAKVIKANPVLEMDEWDLPKVFSENPAPYDKGVDAAAAALAKAIDEEVIKQLINSPTIRPSQNAIQALLGASKAVYDSETSTMPFDRWFNSWSDSIK